MSRSLALLASASLITLAACSATPSAPAPLTSLHLTGHTARSAAFTTSGSWNIAYRYDCSAAHKQGRITISVNGRTLHDETHLAGFGEDVQSSIGAQRLAISSTCSWTVNVTRD